jgi:NTE family protein
MEQEHPPVGLVVAGAGARGAYEAGALSVLAPAMAADDAAPTILVGVSAGALNVVMLAGYADEGWKRASEELVGQWSSVTMREVADVIRSLAIDAATFSAQLLGVPVRLPSLLDTRVQRHALAARLRLDALHHNIASGPIDAVAVAATSVTTGGTVVFVEKKPSVRLPAYDAKRNITYVETQLRVEHVLASAAVPLAFRPIEITEPSSVAGWYIDGGVRLNVPLKPAIAMQCSRLGVVATHPSSWPLAQPRSQNPGPDIYCAASLMVQALMSDRMVEDLMTLSKVNQLVPPASQAGDYHEIEFCFAGPSPTQAGAIGELANDVFAANYSCPRGLAHPDVCTLERLIGGASREHGELLSFLLFEPPFTTQAAALGAAHAGTALAAAPNWRTQLEPPAS